MKNNNKGKFKQIKDMIYTHRKLVMLLLIFIILPVICISTLYIGEYQKNKPVIFETVEKTNMTDRELQKKMEFELVATKYTEPTFNSDDSVASSGNIKFSITLGDKLDKNIDSNSIKVKLVAGAYWIGYTSNETTSTSVKFNDDATTTIYGINEKFPQSPLFLVNINRKDLYVFALITFNEKIEGSNEYKEVNALVKYNYNDYVNKDTNF